MTAPILSKHHSNMTNLTQHQIKVEKEQISYLDIYLCQNRKWDTYIYSKHINHLKQRTNQERETKNVFLATMKTNFHLHMLR